MGAFLTFLFVQLGELIRKRTDLLHKHWSSRMRLEHLFNGYLDAIGGNLSELEEILTTFEPRKIVQATRVRFNKLDTFPIDQETLLLMGAENTGQINLWKQPVPAPGAL